MSSPLLSVPRKTTGEVDFGPAVRQVVNQTYGENAERYSDEIATLNRARQDAVRGTAGSDATARDLLYRYFGQLELFELRFPEIRVAFPWNDAFTPGKSISQSSLAYEKASVIFNIAATLSTIAAAQNRGSPEGLKRSFNYYRSAAGMFTYINDNFLHAPSTDLGKELVKILVTLMTAQATEVFVERMTEEKRGPGLKSKICLQIATIYTGVQDEVKEQVGKALFDRAWLILVQTKARYFTALAQYNRSLADTAAGKHGIALARLGLADTAIKDAERLAMTYGSSYYIASAASAASTLPPDAANSLQEMCKSLLALIGEAKQTAQNDNDLIYHDLVPSEASLPPIDKAASVADPLPIQEIYAAPEVQKLVGQDIFIKLVPLSVIESSSLYSEEKAKILRSEGERCEIADGEMTTGLEHLGLPGSLSKFRGATGSDMNALSDPGAQVRGYATEIKAEELAKRMDAYITELTQLKDRANADLEYCSRELDNEQRECEQARVKFDHLFEQSPSASHTRAWRSDIKTDRDALAQAQASDARVLSLWSGVRGDVGLLAANNDALDSFYAETLAKTDHSSSNGASNLLDLDIPDDEGAKMTQSIQTITDAISKLHKLKKERNDVLADLKERIHNDDISQLLIVNRRAQNVEPSLFAAELEKFRPHQARLAATIQAQQNTMEVIQLTFNKLTSGKKGQEIQTRWAKTDRARKELTARFQRAYDSYREIRTGVIKGVEFYTELNGMLAQLRTDISHFVSSRAAERSQMVSTAEVKQRLQSASTASAPPRQGGLESAFDTMSLSSRPSQMDYQSRQMSQQSTGPSPAPYGSQSQSPYGAYASSSPAPPSQPAYAYNTAPSPATHIPSLPPKPTASSSAYQSPQRQPSTGGLPPPPQQTQYQPRAPPPPPPLNYSAPGYGAPPSTYGDIHQSSYQSYGQPSAPPRPPSSHPSQPPAQYSSYSSPPPQNQYGQPQSNQYQPSQQQAYPSTQPQQSQYQQPPSQYPYPPAQNGNTSYQPYTQSSQPQHQQQYQPHNPAQHPPPQQYRY